MSRPDDFAATRRRARRLVVVAVVVSTALAVLCAGVMWRVSSHVPSTSPAPPGTGAGLPTLAPVVPAGTAAAPVGALTMPADLAFTDLLGVALPVSATHGPADLAGGRGFARTPIGAVLAATHIITRTTPRAGPRVFEPVLRDRVTGAGTDVAKLRFDTTAEYDKARDGNAVPYGDPVGRLTAVFRGWRVEAASDNEVTLRLLTETPDKTGKPVLVTGVMQMVWRNNDWALVAPPNGDWRTSMAVVAEAATGTYQPFAAGR